MHSDYGDSTLDNFGAIFSSSLRGVAFLGNNGLIINELGAVISGFVGIFVNGDSETIHNFGNVYGEDGIYFGGSSNHIQLINHGSIVAPGAIYVASDFDGGIIDNYGAVSSDLVGITVNTFAGLTTQVFNAVGATITGTIYAILIAGSGHGALHLVNAGSITGTIDCPLRPIRSSTTA
jgi:hypothetical protein